MIQELLSLLTEAKLHNREPHKIALSAGDYAALRREMEPYLTAQDTTSTTKIMSVAVIKSPLVGPGEVVLVFPDCSKLFTEEHLEMIDALNGPSESRKKLEKYFRPRR